MNHYFNHFTNFVLHRVISYNKRTISPRLFRTSLNSYFILLNALSSNVSINYFVECIAQSIPITFVPILVKYSVSEPSTQSSGAGPLLLQNDTSVQKLMDSFHTSIVNLNYKNWRRGIHDAIIATTVNLNKNVQWLGKRPEIFSTIIALDAMHGIPTFNKESIIDSLTYITKKMKPNGGFNFFDDSTDSLNIPDDVDCTSLAWSSLLLFDPDSVDKERLNLVVARIIKNIDPKTGVIQVYFPTQNGKRETSDGKGGIRSREGRLDAVVCINALRLLFINKQRHEDTENYIFDTLQNRRYLSGTLYYPKSSAFFIS